MLELNKEHFGDNIELLKQLPDNSIDAIVTDPPYGLGKEPNAEEMLRAWLECGYLEVKGTGFMGRKWDAFVPQPIFWKEVYRALKPGGHILSFFGVRTYDWGVMAMRLAGFEIRDNLQWLHGQGFPKSQNISIAIDKYLNKEREVVGYKENEKDFRSLGKNTKEQYGLDKLGIGVSCERKNIEITIASSDEAKLYDGFGTNLKPAFEPIALARKPIEKGLTIAENVLKYGTGAINIDACRIKHAGLEDYEESVTKNQHADFNSNDGIKVPTKGICGGDFRAPENYEAAKGRFPANIIFSHSPDCEFLGYKKVKGTSTGNGDAEIGEENNGAITPIRRGKFTDRTDEEGLEEVEVWQCSDNCVIHMLDLQSGITTSGKVIESKAAYESESNTNFLKGVSNANNQHGDTGGASRFYKHCNYNEEEIRFFYCPKASTAERNFGLEDLNIEKQIGHNRFDKCKNCGGYILQNPDRPSACHCENPERENNIVKGNHHPTVKPCSLIEYLLKLIYIPKGIVLDPFGGSGTTGIACKMLGIDFILMESDEEYVAIANARIATWNPDDPNLKGRKKIFIKEEKEDENQLSLF